MCLRSNNLQNEMNPVSESKPIYNRRNINSYYNKYLQLSYLKKLFISYLIIVVTCVGSMGLFSYKLESENIKTWAIKSNYELLNNFKNTIDNFIFDSINKLSLIVLQNAINNSDISFFFLNPVEGHYSNLLKVSAFLNNIKATNPLISSISIYYKNNDLLVTTDGIKYSSDDINTLPDRTYIKDLYYSDAKEYWGLKKEFLSPLSDQEEIYITFVRRIFPPTSPFEGGGSIAVAINEDLLYASINTSAPAAFGQIFIVDEEGQIVSHNEKNYLFSNIKNMSCGKSILESTKDSDYFIRKVNNTDSIVSFVSSNYNSWKYVTIQPITDLVKSKAHFLGRTILLITAITLLFGIFISFISSRRIYTPLENLMNLCKNILKVRSHNKEGDEYKIITSTLDVLTLKVKEQEKTLTESVPIIKHHFVQNLLKSHNHDEEIIYEKMEFLDINLNFDYFTVLVLKLEDYPKDLDFKMLEMVKLNIVEKIEHIFCNNSIVPVCSEENDIIDIIVNLKCKDIDITTYVKKLVYYINNVLKLNVYIGMGNIYAGMNNIYASYKEAELCKIYSYIYPENNIFVPTDIIEWESKTDEVLRTAYEDFCNSIKSLDKISSLESINNIIETIRREKISYNHSMKILILCVGVIENTITEYKIYSDNIIYDDIYTDFSNIQNILKLNKWFKIIITQIFTYLDERKTGKKSDFIKDVQEFISKNILNPSISLNYVADAMHISPAYLSRMFKQETGVNFVDFLMEQRLAAAEEILLVDKSIKIEDVCTAIGYSSTQYFIRKFKLKYGLTPGEYRLSYFRGIEKSGI